MGLAAVQGLDAQASFRWLCWQIMIRGIYNSHTTYDDPSECSRWCPNREAHLIQTIGFGATPVHSDIPYVRAVLVHPAGNIQVTLSSTMLVMMMISLTLPMSLVSYLLGTRHPLINWWFPGCADRTNEQRVISYFTGGVPCRGGQTCFGFSLHAFALCASSLA